MPGIYDWHRFKPGVIPMTVPGAPPPVPAITTPTPPSRPPSLTMFPGLPMGPQTRETVIQPPPSVPGTGNRPPIPLLGPGEANPSITGAPTTPVMPGTEFGNPATREALRTLANQDPNADLLERVKRGDFNGAIGDLGKMMGGGGGGAPPAARIDFPQPGRAPQPHQPNTSGELAKIMAGLPSVEERQKFKQKQAQRRKTQDRFDLENMERR
jgi:hypothetical protein